MNFSKKLYLILLIGIIFFVQFIEHFPDYYGYLKKPADLWYTGQVAWFDPWDVNVYVSAIGVGRQGSIWFKNVYDSVSQTNPLPIYFVYTLLGWFFASFNLSNFLIFHLGGLFFGLCFMVLVWWFIGLFLEKRSEKLLVFAFLFLSGGLGWLFFPDLVTPDLGNPGFLMLSPLHRPHEAVSFAFLLLALGFLFQGVVWPKKLNLLLGGLFALATICFHPYNLIILVVAFFGLAFSQSVFGQTHRFWQAIGVSLLAGGLFYLLLGRQLLGNHSFAGLSGQVQFSANPFHFILGWGFLFPFILLGFFGKADSIKVAFCKNWFLFHWLAVYLPIHFQKLFIRGLYLPAVFLAFFGLKKVAQRLKMNFYFLAILLLIFSSISFFYMFFLRIAEVDKAVNRWLYLTKEEGELINYLAKHGQAGEGVLAAYRLANIIPAYTNKKVYAGHPFQTPDFEKRIKQVERFLAGEMEEKEAGEFLTSAGIKWIVVGVEENIIPKGKNWPYQSSLRIVKISQNVTLYERIAN